MRRFIRTWCEEWTEEREAAGDYRILMYDVASSHIGPCVKDALWERGYVGVQHYGSTTAVGQVNDTHCHSGFEAE